MVKTPLEMRALAQDLTVSVWTLSAIGTLFESGLVEHLRESMSLDDLAVRCPALSKTLIKRCLAVAAAAGVVAAGNGHYQLAQGAMPFSQQPFRMTLQGEIRSSLMQPLVFLNASAGRVSGSGWSHADSVLLQAQGDASAMFPPMFKANIVPSLGDLAARLDGPGARFLDVGVGVASLAIAMCRTWPGLRVVGLDTFEATLAIALENVTRTNLQDRIELLKIAVEDFRDEEKYDLAWLPSFFIAAPDLPAAIGRVRTSLRPGGWLLFPIGDYIGDELSRSVFALINECWGGPALSFSEAESLLKEAGFEAIRALPAPPAWPPLFVAQRAMESR